MSTEPSDDELLVRAREEGAAFEAFHRRHADAVTGSVMRRRRTRDRPRLS